MLGDEEKKDRERTAKKDKFLGACEQGDMKCVKEWVDDKLIDESTLNEGLSYAISGKNVEVVGYLIDQKADTKSIGMGIMIGGSGVDVFKVVYNKLVDQKEKEAFIRAIFQRCVSLGNVGLGKYLIFIGAKESFGNDMETLMAVHEENEKNKE